MKNIILSGLILLLSLSVYANPLPQQPHVYVEGSSTIEIEPDEMSFSLNIMHTSKELADAKSEVDDKSHKLISLCKKLGIKPKDIATSTLRIAPQYKYNDRVRVQTGNQVSRQVDITLRDLSNYAATIKAFIDAEITQTVNTKLLLSDQTSVTDKALANALTDAQQRATVLAKHQNKKLGKVYSISEFNTRGQERYQLNVSRGISGQLSSGGITSRSIGVARASDNDSEPFEPGTIKATAQVYVVYLLD